MEGYKVEISSSSRELTARERIAIKDTTNSVKLDEKTSEDGKVTITPVGWAVLSIHNEKSENKDYDVYVIEDKDGTKYCTGSQSFMESFTNIASEMYGEEEEYSIVCYRVPSKNYKGKDFLTCSIL